MQDSLGSLEGGAGFPGEFGLGVEYSLGNLECMIRRGDVFPEGKPDFLGNFTRGCRIPWGAELPVTLGSGNETKTACSHVVA